MLSPKINTMNIETLLAVAANMVPGIFGGITALVKMVSADEREDVRLTFWKISGLLIQAFATGYLVGGGLAAYFKLDGALAGMTQFLCAVFSTELLAIIGTLLKDKDALSLLSRRLLNKSNDNEKKQ